MNSDIYNALWTIVAPGGALLLVLGAVVLTRGMPGVLARRALVRIKPSMTSTVMGFAVFGTALAVAALTVVTAISSGFVVEFQRRVLGVNAHVVILRYGFAEYREVLEAVEQIPGVTSASPFVLNEMMIVSGRQLAGVLLKGVDPQTMPSVLDVPTYMREGSLRGLRRVPNNQEQEHSTETPTWLREWSEGDPDPLPTTVTNSLAGIVPRDETADASAQILDVAVAEALGLNHDEIISAAQESDDEALPGLVLGTTLAGELDVLLGESVRVVTPLAGLNRSFWGPQDGAARSQEFRVIGIFHSGFDEYDRRLVIVDLREAQAFGGQGDVATGIELRTDHPSQAMAIGEMIRHQLGRAYQILDWSELNANLFAALELQKIALTLVVSALVLVAGLLVIATLVMMIFERKRDIAILKAMGASDRSIMQAFALIGATVGTLGNTLGIALGLIVCWILDVYGFQLDPRVYIIDRLPLVISTLDLLMVSGITQVITLIAALVPAWFTAARLNPIEGLIQE